MNKKIIAEVIREMSTSHNTWKELYEAATRRLIVAEEALMDAAKVLGQLSDRYCGLNDMTARSAIAKIEVAMRYKAAITEHAKAQTADEENRLFDGVVAATDEYADFHGWQELHDAVIGLIPERFRQNSTGAISCVKKLVDAYDTAMQENHEFRHGYRSAKPETKRRARPGNSVPSDFL